MPEIDEGERLALDRRDWATVYELLRARDHSGDVDRDDLERLAVVAHLVGDDAASDRAWEKAHQTSIEQGNEAAAAQSAFWLGFSLLLRGEMAQGGGWLARANRLVEDCGRDCVTRGYLMVPAALEALNGGDPSAAEALSAEAAEVARAFDDPDLMAFARLGRAQASILRGDTTGGVAQLDEVMVAVTMGEVSPIPAGIIYCAVIAACMEAFDLQRAAEWTEALHRWCVEQPDLVPYRGQCLVHRSQILQVRGDWPGAAKEAALAQERLSQPVHPALGTAFYQRAELYRLRGDLGKAEAAYRDASRHGREPMPGLALLRLAEGRADAAAIAIRRAVAEPRGNLARTALLAAFVEVMLGSGDVRSAEQAARELETVALELPAPVLRATACHARGATELAAGHAAVALGALREAASTWTRLAMPYESARARALVALAYQALGDSDMAELERDAAQSAFEHLGAMPDIRWLADQFRESTAPAGSEAEMEREVGAAATRVGPLSGREQEVLRLVAAGKTNRRIASELYISEHTVGRHLQNIFSKLAVTSRAAATAYAYEHGLL